MSRENKRLHDDILELRRQLKNQTSERPATGFSSKDFVVIATSTLLAIAGLFSDDLWIVFGCLAASFIAFLYLVAVHPRSRRQRLAMLAVLLVFPFTMGVAYCRVRTRAQNDVYTRLEAQAFLPSSKNVLRTGITVINHGATDLSEHSVMCYLRRITYAPYGGISTLSMGTAPPAKSSLRAFGDGETSYCIAGIGSMEPNSHAICADITVTVSYALETQPNVKRTKKFRFVAGGEDFVYRQQPVEYPGDYCPEPRLPPSAPLH